MSTFIWTSFLITALAQAMSSSASEEAAPLDSIHLALNVTCHDNSALRLWQKSANFQRNAALDADMMDVNALQLLQKKANCQMQKTHWHLKYKEVPHVERTPPRNSSRLSALVLAVAPYGKSKAFQITSNWMWPVAYMIVIALTLLGAGRIGYPSPGGEDEEVESEAVPPKSTSTAPVLKSLSPDRIWRAPAPHTAVVSQLPVVENPVQSFKPQAPGPQGSVKNVSLNAVEVPSPQAFVETFDWQSQEVWEAEQAEEAFAAGQSEGLLLNVSSPEFLQPTFAEGIPEFEVAQSLHQFSPEFAVFAPVQPWPEPTVAVPVMFNIATPATSLAPGMLPAALRGATTAPAVLAVPPMGQLPPVGQQELSSETYVQKEPEFAVEELSSDTYVPQMPADTYVPQTPTDRYVPQTPAFGGPRFSSDSYMPQQQMLARIEAVESQEDDDEEEEEAEELDEDPEEVTSRRFETQPDAIPLEEGVVFIEPEDVYETLSTQRHDRAKFKYRDTFKLVDVRDQKDRDAGRIEDAIHVPRNDANAGFDQKIDELLAKFEHLEVVAFHCQFSSDLAPYCAKLYRSRAPENQTVAIMHGGFRGWLELGLPIVPGKGELADKVYAESVAIQEGKQAAEEAARANAQSSLLESLGGIRGVDFLNALRSPS